MRGSPGHGGSQPAGVVQVYVEFLRPEFPDQRSHDVLHLLGVAGANGVGDGHFVLPRQTCARQLRQGDGMGPS